MTIESSNLLIVGCVKDVENEFCGEFDNLVKATAKFKNRFYLFVESDSNDKTCQILSKYKNDINNFEFISLGKIKNNFKFRCQRIAHCRNAYVKEINTNKVYENVDYIMVVDLDGINSLLNEKSIHSCFVRNDWHGVFANQKKAYYDIYALRHKYWSPNDCRLELNFFDKYRKSRSFNYWHSVYSKMIEIPENSEWIEVSSAFGGAGIYKRECFVNNLYVGEEENEEVCEHVSFNKTIIKQGFNLYINPNFINSAFNEHIKKKFSIRQKLKFALQTLFVK